MAEAEIRLLDAVLSKLAFAPSATSAAGRAGVAAQFMVPVLAKLGSPHASVRAKAKEVVVSFAV